MLGRQKLRYFKSRKQWRIPFRKHYQKALDRHNHPFQITDLIQDDSYAETFLRKLGLGTAETMDFSDYEFSDSPDFVGCLHDLNTPVPKELWNRYDFIFDGGTLEHLFNVPQALENVFRMLKPGGRFIGVNPMNNWPGHGMYQFSPELVYSFWVRKAGCTVHNCYAMEDKPNGYFKKMADPVTLSGRSRIGYRLLIKRVLPRGKIYLYHEVEKTSGGLEDGSIQQTSYLKRWDQE